MAYPTGPDSFPRLPGSHLDLKSPGLEFVKAVCHVLSLDPVVELEVQVLRRSLLAQVGVREFAPEAQFVDPCQSVTLPDVVCAFCSTCTTLDLARHPSALDPNKEVRWKCEACDQPYDTKKMELQLVEMIQRQSVRFQLQDLRCQKCNTVFTKMMAPHCDCSGNLVSDESGQGFLSRLHTIRRIASFHGFEWVVEAVDDILMR
eukprot:CAMPEP_0113949516 /NCGR_PEP_ID=MMETSP1339-20121228/76025_1 /TAXON_ID=94617 /ORGANISM="Fibrocapsa japonica" /LENGTH=202 /DNA_ID=CAMNT_0000956999 /DNA_START=49 /DNA_END=657 /DNA_ORIENTATION=- /assembly_acc=CAM_ASM_000762